MADEQLMPLFVCVPVGLFVCLSVGFIVAVETIYSHLPLGYTKISKKHLTQLIMKSYCINYTITEGLSISGLEVILTKDDSLLLLVILIPM